MSAIGGVVLFVAVLTGGFVSASAFTAFGGVGALVSVPACVLIGIGAAELLDKL